MKIAPVTLSIVVGVFLLLLNGCTRGAETTSNTSAKTTPPPPSSANAPNNSNHPAPVAGSNRNADTTKSSDAASESAKPKGPAELVGTYESREVHSEGVVTVMSKLRTIWLFSAEGNYSRVSTVNGKTYHADSGTFRLEAPDKLVLTIQMTGQKANRKIQSPAVIKTHKYTLSPDGEELRLISDKGSIGIFQRVAKPTPPRSPIS